MWLLIAVAIAVGAAWAFDWALFSDEITLYPARCADSNTPFDECKNVITLNRSTYKLNRQRAEAIYWYETSWGDDLKKLVDCKIRNRKNWNCSFPDGSGKIVVRNGKGVETNPEARRLKHGYVRRWQWHWIRWKSVLAD